MKVCGIDPSSTSFAVALLDGQDLVETAVWRRPKGQSSAPQRLVDCHAWLVGWLIVHRPDMAAIEFLSVERNAQATRMVAQYQCLAALASKQQGLMVIEGRVTSARSIVLGNGAAKKEEAYAAMKKRYPKFKFLPFGKGGDDEADAVLLALAGPELAERS